MSDIALAKARQKFLDSLKSRRSDNTLLTYNKALETFVNMLRDRHLDASSFPVAELNEDFLVDFVVHIKHLSPSTESLYLQVVKNFFEFLNAERLNDLNVSRVRMIIRQRTRRLRAVASEYPEEKIKLLIETMAKLAERSTTENNWSDR